MKNWTDIIRRDLTDLDTIWEETANMAAQRVAKFIHQDAGLR